MRTLAQYQLIKMWDLFVNDYILAKGETYNVIHIEDGFERCIVVAEATDGSLHTFNNTVYRVVVKR